MGVRFSERAKNQLHFELICESQDISLHDITGTLYNISSAYSESYNLKKFQQEGLIGKITFIKNQHAQQKKNFCTGVIVIPTSLDYPQCCILCAIIQSITKIKLFRAKIVLKAVDQTQKKNMKYLVNRAVEIYRTHFSTADESGDIKKTFLDLTSAKKSTELGGFIVGADFYVNKSTIVVEGRADVVKLASLGLNNTFAISGYNFMVEDVQELLKEKQVTVFFDNDTGGDQVRKKFLKNIPTRWQIFCPKGVSVEDLSKKELFEALKSKAPVLGSQN